MESEEPEILKESGNCGDNITWSITQTGAGLSTTRTLKLTGTGAMPDYAKKEDAPWYKSWSTIHAVEVGEGITSTGSYAFCEEITARLPSTLKTIGDHTFADNKNLKYVYFPESIRTVGIGAFEGCTNLKRVCLWGSSSSDRLEIKSSAFKDSGIKSITFPKYLKKFGSNSFSGCAGAYVCYPEGGIYYNNSFYDESKAGEKLNGFMKSDGGYGSNYLSSKYFCGMMGYIGCDFTLQDGYMQLSEGTMYSFDSKNLYPWASRKIRTVTMQSDCENIGDYAFQGQTNIENVTLFGKRSGSTPSMAALPLKE